MSLVLSRISTTHLHLDCVNYFSMWFAATQARLLNLRYSFKFLLFLWIFNSVSGKSNNATITKARCYANCLTKVSNLSIERLSTTFTSNGRREFVRALGRTWPSFTLACRLLFIISTHKLAVSHNFLSISFWAVFICSFSLLTAESQLESDVCRLPYTWSLIETFRFKDENDYECEIWLQVFSRILKI